MNTEMAMTSIKAFSTNAINSLVYGFRTNWCLVLLVAATVISVVLGILNESASVVHEEQNIL